MSFVYFMEATGLDTVKIGYAGDPWRRLAKVQSDCPAPVAIVALVAGDLALEGQLHARFEAHRRNREWFHFAPPIREYVAALPDIISERRARKALGGALGAWLHKNRMTGKAFSEKAGTTHATISRLCSGRARPSYELLLAIYAATNGEVTPNHMLGVGD